MKTKRCSRCKADKPVTEFYPDITNKYDGLQGYYKECFKAHSKAKDNSPSKSKRDFKRLLEAGEKPEYDREGFITVECKNSMHGVHRFRPTAIAIHNRTTRRKSDLKRGKGAANHYMYCSDKCKDECPLYNTGIDIDNNCPVNIQKIETLIARQEDPNVTKEVRGCMKEVKDSLLASQVDNHGYTFCEVCGEKQDTGLHDHHTLPVAIHGREAINAATQMIVCQSCHVKKHSECGGI